MNFKKTCQTANLDETYYAKKHCILKILTENDKHIQLGKIRESSLSPASAAASVNIFILGTAVRQGVGVYLGGLFSYQFFLNIMRHA